MTEKEKNKEEEAFQDWYFNQGGFKIAESVYSKQAEKNALKIESVAPKEVLNEDGFITNLYTDELEKLAKENKLHLIEE